MRTRKKKMKIKELSMFIVHLTYLVAMQRKFPGRAERKCNLSIAE